MIHDHRALLLDEPTNDLDPAQRRGVLALVRSHGAVCPVLVSTHAVRDVFPVAQAVLVLHRGTCLFTGSTEEFLETFDPEHSDPESAYTRCIAGKGDG